MTSSHDLAGRWIESDSVKSDPEEARVKGYGVHVWALLNLLTTYYLDRQTAARAYELPDEAVDAVLAYYVLHMRVLDARVALVPSDDPMPRTKMMSGESSLGKRRQYARKSSVVGRKAADECSGDRFRR